MILDGEKQSVSAGSFGDIASDCAESRQRRSGQFWCSVRWSDN